MKQTEYLVECPHCFRKGVMDVVAESPIISNEDNDIHEDWRIFRCKQCECIHIWHYIEETIIEAHGEHGYDKREKLIYPQNFRVFKHLPKDVKQSYESAKTVFHNTNAFAGMVRRTLEFVCKDKKAPEKKGRNYTTLDNKLKYLVDKKHIPPQLKEIAKNLRLLGNDGIHANTEEFSREDAITMGKLLEAILEYLYEAPAMLAELEDRAKNLN